ncbi:Vitamin B6 transporter [Sporothrix curviconia]|uniref:Vitamin B6 transporter n=1 Tax=Sporothrix curviconia TaxID=1260050 RepID=A0ABP0B5P2_9PEZI
MSDQSTAEKGTPYNVPHDVPHDLLDVVEAGEVIVSDGPRFLGAWTAKLESLLGLEARGVERVPEHQRLRKVTVGDYLQMTLIWFSSNLTLNNLAIGVLGPTAYYLGMTDSMLLGVFGVIAGSAGTAYISTFGPLSGNRTLVIARYTMGWWPSKLCVALNIVIMLGYGLVDSLLTGQLLSAVSGGSMTVIVGTVIAAVLALLVATVGIKLFHVYERYAFVPQICVLFILIGVAGPYFDTSIQSTGSSAVVSADRMSYFMLSASAPLAWSPAGADFFVYFPPDAKRRWVFLSTLVGLAVGSFFPLLLGVGLACGSLTNPAWAAAYDTSLGALVDEALSPLGVFGKICSVILGLGLIANNVPGQYSAALSFQLLGRWFRYLPRFVWVIIGTVIYTVLACAGRNSFYEIFSDFLALMGYWCVMWVWMTICEELIFRRGDAWYKWEDWNRPDKLPIGLAALAAFCVGWVGAVLSMWEIYFTGPIAKLVGDGIDLGIPVGGSWAVIVYVPLRYLELKYLHR